mgnify:CR=1 FL=1
MTDASTPDALLTENREAVGFVLRLARAMHSYGYPAHRVEGALGEAGIAIEHVAPPGRGKVRESEVAVNRGKRAG